MVLTPPPVQLLRADIVGHEDPHSKSGVDREVPHGRGVGLEACTLVIGDGCMLLVIEYMKS